MDLAPEHGYLVAQHYDFDRQMLVLAKAEPNQLKDPTKRSVEEREGHGWGYFSRRDPVVKVQLSGHGRGSRHLQVSYLD